MSDQRYTIQILVEMRQNVEAAARSAAGELLRLNSAATDAVGAVGRIGSSVAGASAGLANLARGAELVVRSTSGIAAGASGIRALAESANVASRALAETNATSASAISGMGLLAAAHRNAATAATTQATQERAAASASLGASRVIPAAISELQSVSAARASAAAAAVSQASTEQAALRGSSVTAAESASATRSLAAAQGEVNAVDMVPGLQREGQALAAVRNEAITTAAAIRQVAVAPMRQAMPAGVQRQAIAGGAPIGMMMLAATGTAAELQKVTGETAHATGANAQLSATVRTLITQLVSEAQALSKFELMAKYAKETAQAREINALFGRQAALTNEQLQLEATKLIAIHAAAMLALGSYDLLSMAMYRVSERIRNAHGVPATKNAELGQPAYVANLNMSRVMSSGAKISKEDLGEYDEISARFRNAQDKWNNLDSKFREQAVRIGLTNNTAREYVSLDKDKRASFLQVAARDQVAHTPEVASTVAQVASIESVIAKLEAMRAKAAAATKQIANLKTELLAFHITEAQKLPYIAMSGIQPRPQQRFRGEKRSYFWTDPNVGARALTQGSLGEVQEQKAAYLVYRRPKTHKEDTEYDSPQFRGNARYARTGVKPQDIAVYDNLTGKLTPLVDVVLALRSAFAEASATGKSAIEVLANQARESQAAASASLVLRAAIDGASKSLAVEATELTKFALMDRFGKETSVAAKNQRELAAAVQATNGALKSQASVLAGMKGFAGGFTAGRPRDASGKFLSDAAIRAHTDQVLSFTGTGARPRDLETNKFMSNAAIAAIQAQRPPVPPATPVIAAAAPMPPDPRPIIAAHAAAARMQQIAAEQAAASMASVAAAERAVAGTGMSAALTRDASAMHQLGAEAERTDKLLRDTAKAPPPPATALEAASDQARFARARVLDVGQPRVGRGTLADPNRPDEGEILAAERAALQRRAQRSAITPLEFTRVSRMAGRSENMEELVAASRHLDNLTAKTAAAGSETQRFAQTQTQAAAAAAKFSAENPKIASGAQHAIEALRREELVVQGLAKAWNVEESAVRRALATQKQTTAAGGMHGMMDKVGGLFGQAAFLPGEAGKAGMEGFMAVTAAQTVGAGHATAAGAGFAVAGIAALVEEVRNLSEAGEKLGAFALEMKNMAQKTGISTTEIQAFAAAGEAVGVSTAEMQVGLRFLNRNLAQGDPLLKQLGVTSKDTSEAFYQLAAAFENSADDAAKTEVAVRLLGRGGTAMVPFLNQGANAVREHVMEVKALGAVYGSEVLPRMLALRQEAVMNEHRWKAFTIAIQQASLPAIEFATNIMSTVMQAFQTLGQAIQVGTTNFQELMFWMERIASWVMPSGVAASIIDSLNPLKQLQFALREMTDDLAAERLTQLDRELVRVSSRIREMKQQGKTEKQIARTPEGQRAADIVFETDAIREQQRVSHLSPRQRHEEGAKQFDSLQLKLDAEAREKAAKEAAEAEAKHINKLVGSISGLVLGTDKAKAAATEFARAWVWTDDRAASLRNLKTALGDAGEQMDEIAKAAVPEIQFEKRVKSAAERLVELNSDLQEVNLAPLRAMQRAIDNITGEAGLLGLVWERAQERADRFGMSTVDALKDVKDEVEELKKAGADATAVLSSLLTTQPRRLERGPRSRDMRVSGEDGTMRLPTGREGVEIEGLKRQRDFPLAPMVSAPAPPQAIGVSQGENAQAIFKMRFQELTDEATKLSEVSAHLAESLFAVTTDGITGMLDALIDKTRSMQDAITAMLKDITKQIIGAMLKFALLSGINAITGGGGGALMKMGVPGFTYPHAAQGGIVSMPQKVLVGEAGPEAIIPLSRLPGMLNASRMSGPTQPSTVYQDNRTINVQALDFSSALTHQRSAFGVSRKVTEAEAVRGLI